MQSRLPKSQCIIGAPAQYCVQNTVILRIRGVCKADQKWEACAKISNRSGVALPALAACKTREVILKGTGNYFAQERRSKISMLMQ